MNLPKHVTSDDENDAQEHEDTDEALRISEATELLTYLWDNYVELNDSTHVFLMGTNVGHGAIINFVKANEDRAQERLTKVISFVEDVPLRACSSPTNDQFQAWYYRTSLVFVAKEHNYSRSEYANKTKKRWGRVHISKEDSISDMLAENKDIVTHALLEETRQWRAARPTDTEMQGTEASPKGLPAVGNFALSQRGNGFHNGDLLAPKEGKVRSPPKAMPPLLGNFALSPRQR